MDAIVAIYQSQPVWIWLVLSCLILAIEAAAGTEWLLWPAVSAAIVAVVVLVAPSLGPAIQIGLFAFLTLVSTLTSRRLIKRVNPTDPDINDRARTLIGRQAEVTHAFVDGRGRVFVGGSEWAAITEGDSPQVGASVKVHSVDGTLLKVE